MSNGRSSWLAWSIVSLTLVALAAIGVPARAQDSPKRSVGNIPIKGLPDDWTHHHVVFSNPGTEEQAIKSGHYAEWLKVVNDPRYAIHQLKRGLPVQGPLSQDAASIERLAAANKVSLGNEKFDIHHRPIGRPIKNHILNSAIERDWNEEVDSPTTQAGTFTAPTPLAYPAKWNFSSTTASCADDYVIYPTGAAGAPDTSGGVPPPNGQASIIAYYNLYEGGCTTGLVPSIDWAYNTGGAVITAPALALSGNEVAFVQSSGGVASLVLLKFPVTPPGTGTLASPITLTAETSASNFYGCNAPCMYVMPLSPGTVDDTWSNPYYDYLTDSLYVGDSAGYLHKFTPVFDGMPGEVTTGGWPVQLARGVTIDGNQLASPVYDDVSGYVLVGTLNPTFGSTAGGYLYAVDASSGAISAYSGQLDVNYGISDAVLLDSVAEQAYVFVGDDNSTYSNLVDQFSVGGTLGLFPSGSTGTASAPLDGIKNSNSGSEYAYQLSGTFDNAYYTSNSATPTGNLYVCGASTPGTLYQIAISGGVMGTVTAGPQIADGARGAGRCSPVTEFFNSSAGTGGEDLLFVSVYQGLATIGGAPTRCIDNADFTFTGCVMSFNVTMPSSFTTTLAPLGTLDVTAFSDSIPTGGLIIDNAATNVTGASQFYFLTLVNDVGTGIPCVTGDPNLAVCAVQASQILPAP